MEFSLAEIPFEIQVLFAFELFKRFCRTKMEWKILFETVFKGDFKYLF